MRSYAEPLLDHVALGEHAWSVVCVIAAVEGEAGVAYGVLDADAQQRPQPGLVTVERAVG